MLRPARTIQAVVFFLFILGVTTFAEPVNQLRPNGFVNDYANVLDAESVRQMNFLCTQVNQKASAQIAVVTIKSLDGATIESYANRLFKKWGIGPRTNNHGVLVLLAVDDRKYRIEVGRGLEAVITDRQAAAFGREAVPYLKQFQYGTALRMITQRVTDAVAADAHISIPEIPPPPTPVSSAASYSNNASSSSDGGLQAGTILLIIVVVVVIILLAIGRGASLGGGYYQPYYGYPGGGYVHVEQNYYGGFGGSSSGNSWSGGGGFGGGGGFSGFGGSSDSSSSSSSFGGGDSGGGGASGDY